MEDFEKKLSISDPVTSGMDVENEQGEKTSNASSPKSIVGLLRKFLAVQQRRAHAYARLKRGFDDYLASGGEMAYQQLCSEITVEFNDCSKQVVEIEALFLSPDCCRDDLASLLRSVQTKEKDKLHLGISGIGVHIANTYWKREYIITDVKNCYYSSVEKGWLSI